MHSVLTCLDPVLAFCLEGFLAEKGVCLRNIPQPDLFQLELQRLCRAEQAPPAVVTGVQRLTATHDAKICIERYGNDNLFLAVCGRVPLIFIFGTTALALQQENEHHPPCSTSQIIYIPVEEMLVLVDHLTLACVLPKVS